MTKNTLPMLKEFKKQHRRIVGLTCYDFSMAQVLNNAGIDLLLVGDSLGMVKLGYPSTLPVTVDDMIYHTRIVARGNTHAILVTDMPYLSYQVTPADAVKHCGRAIKEGGAQAVKIEGGQELLPVYQALRAAKIPVIGHLGMTPQSVHMMGGYKVQGRERAAHDQLLKDAKALEKAGAFALVLECIPTALARRISRALAIPTIGIGAGVGCDGQILVIDDLIGWTAGSMPRFVKQYAHIRETVCKAAASYAQDVRQGHFPDAEHSYT